MFDARSRVFFVKDKIFKLLALCELIFASMMANRRSGPKTQGLIDHLQWHKASSQWYNVGNNLGEYDMEG